MNYQELVNKNIIESISKFQKKKTEDALSKGMTEEQIMKSFGINPSDLNNSTVGTAVNSPERYQTPMQPMDKQPQADTQQLSDPYDFSKYRIEFISPQEADTPSGLAVDQDNRTLRVNFGGANSTGRNLNNNLNQLAALQAMTGRTPLSFGEQQGLQVKQAEMQQKEQGKEEQYGRDLRKSYAKMKEEADKPLSGESQKAMQNINDSLAGLDLMEENLKSRKSALPGDKKKKNFDRGKTMATTSYGYLKSGATIGVQEFDRLASLLPDPNAFALEKEDTAKAKISEMRASLLQAKEAMQKVNESKKKNLSKIDKFKQALIKEGYSESEALDTSLKYFERTEGMQ